MSGQVPEVRKEETIAMRNRPKNASNTVVEHQPRTENKIAERNFGCEFEGFVHKNSEVKTKEDLVKV